MTLYEAREGSADLIPALRDHGFDVATLDELRSSGRRYRSAVPLLVDYLKRDLDETEKESIVRALSVPWAGQDALEALVNEFVRQDAGALYRWVVGNAIEVLWTDELWTRLRALATTTEYGRTREMVVLGMAKSEHPEAAEVLRRLLTDSSVNGHALKALRKRKEFVAPDVIESFAKDERSWVRKLAREVLR